MTTGSGSLSPFGREPVGTLIRRWRDRRRLSQMALALDAGISTRHLSFVETGRSNPSPQLLLTLAEQLEVPLRERNALLLAGGFAPRFVERSIDSPALEPVRQALSLLLKTHDPFPALAVDRHWNVVLANQASLRMMQFLPAGLRQPPVNLFRASLHPDGFAAMTENFAEWGSYLLDQLDALVAEARLQADEGAAVLALADEINGYPNVVALRSARRGRAGSARATKGGAGREAGIEGRSEGGMEAGAGGEPGGDGIERLVLPCVMQLGGRRATLLSTIATLGAARDLTLSELKLELFYPADDATRALLQEAAASALVAKPLDDHPQVITGP